MRSRRRWTRAAGGLGAACAAVLAAALAGALADDGMMAPAIPERSFLKPELPAEPQFVPGTDEKFPRLRYADGQISLNDRCPVRHAKLNPRMAPVYVNGKPIGFC